MGRPAEFPRRGAGADRAARMAAPLRTGLAARQNRCPTPRCPPSSRSAPPTPISSQPGPEEGRPVSLWPQSGGGGPRRGSPGRGGSADVDDSLAGAAGEQVVVGRQLLQWDTGRPPPIRESPGLLRPGVITPDVRDRRPSLCHRRERSGRRSAPRSAPTQHAVRKQPEMTRADWHAAEAPATAHHTLGSSGRPR